MEEKEEDPQERIMREMREEAAKVEAEERRKLTLFEALAAHPGWKAYVSLLEDDMYEASSELLEPREALGRDNYLKGRYNGLYTAVSKLPAMVADIRARFPSDEEDAHVD